MDWVDKPQNHKGLYGILQLLQGSAETLKLGWITYSEFQLKCLDFPSNQYRKHAQSSHVSFSNGLYLHCFQHIYLQCFFNVSTSVVELLLKKEKLFFFV